jgi:CRP-like cAMP-binding protein
VFCFEQILTAFLTKNRGHFYACLEVVKARSASSRFETNGDQEMTRTNIKAILLKPGSGNIIVERAKGDQFFSQGDIADSVFYVLDGWVRLTIVSQKGKEAIIRVIGQAEFFGDHCLAGQTRYEATATSLVGSTVVRIEKATMIRLLREDASFSETFMAHLLERNLRAEQDLADQLLHTSEQRLARLLLRLADFTKEGGQAVAPPQFTQELLAAMIGTTRSRVSVFMNRFRKLGFIDYDGELKIHGSLQSLLQPEPLPCSRRLGENSGGKSMKAKALSN